MCLEYFYFGFEFEGRKEVMKWRVDIEDNKKVLLYDLSARERFLKKFPSNLDEMIMKVGNLSFIPDKNIHPVLQDGSNNIAISVYDKLFAKIANLPFSDYSSENPLLIKIEKRLKKTGLIISRFNKPFFSRRIHATGRNVICC